MAEEKKIPNHVAIILDGNGRWAKAKGLPRNAGHVQGARVVEDMCEIVYNMGINYFTVYAFSTENWNRPQEEVDALMELLRKYMKNSIKRSMKNNMCVRIIGDKSRLAPDLQDSIRELEETTANNTGLHFQIAINYGGRDEIVRAARTLAERVQAGTLQPQDITERLLSDALYTAGQPDPDLVIRPSGEFRLSNFLIWQSAYAEFWYDDVLWPDFTPADLDRAIEAYQNRDRRFGNAK